MSKREQTIIVDLYEKSYQEIILKQFDSTEIIFTILKNNDEFSLDGLTAEIWFVKPNGTVVQQSATIDNGKVKAELIPDCVRSYGRGKIEVSLKQNDEEISSFQVDVKIEKSGKENVTSENTPSYIERLENLATEMEILKENIESMAETATAAAENAQSVASDALDIVNELKEEAETAESIINELIHIYSGLEKKHNITRLTVQTEIQEETDYTLPVNYIVGSGDLVIFCDNEILIPETNQHDGNYVEVGEDEAISNKVQFGWNVEVGTILTIIVKGVVEDEENE